MAKNSFTWDHDPQYYHHCGLTGYTGTNPHSIMQMSRFPAVRTQIGWRGLYKGALAILPDGSLITAVCEMEKERRWPIHLFKSCDQGETWNQIAYHPPLFGKELGLTCLQNGGLLLTMEPKVTDPEKPVAYSDDGGKTWSITTMRADTIMEGNWITTVRTPIEHPDGTVSLLRCYGCWEGAEKGKPASQAWLYRSFDGGKTWPQREEIKIWDDPFPLFVEADFLRLPGGKILAASRFEFGHPIQGTKPPWPPGSVGNDHAAGHIVLLESEDEGRTWKGPRDFLNYSEVQGQLTLLSDGRVLCTYTSYHLPFGVAAVVSHDLGKTWDLDHPFQLAISNSVNTGWPTTRELPDGSLLTVYALQPYHLEPDENKQVTFQCVRWKLPL
jgi:hypothetical protein